MNDPESEENPIPKSYWVIPGRFRAGEYPGSLDDGEAEAKVGWLIGAGINFFIDLTQPGEYDLKPYNGFLPESGNIGTEVIHCQMPIADFSIPRQEGMIEILDRIDKALMDGNNIYLHCLGGKGRTGTVVGCYLVRHGMNGEAALERIIDLRRSIAAGRTQSPETDEQRRMVLEWIKGQ